MTFLRRLVDWLFTIRVSFGGPWTADAAPDSPEAAFRPRPGLRAGPGASGGNGARSQFQRVTDDLTGGCGCACHTGFGYRSSCEHCWRPDPLDRCMPRSLP